MDVKAGDSSWFEIFLRCVGKVPEVMALTVLQEGRGQAH